MKELFSLDTKTACNTADLLANYPDCRRELPEGPLSRVASAGGVSFVHLVPAKAMEESLANAEEPGQASSKDSPGGSEAGKGIA